MQLQWLAAGLISSGCKKEHYKEIGRGESSRPGWGDAHTDTDPHWYYSLAGRGSLDPAVIMEGGGEVILPLFLPLFVFLAYSKPDSAEGHN